MCFSPTRDFKNRSSFQPVGSGARALGLSAFIAVVDDGTATSWNPGGLSNLKKPEYSMVIELNHITEKSRFQKNPESSSTDRLWGKNLNYCCFAYPFKYNTTNMAVAISYQRLFDLNREWNFFFHDKKPNEEDKHYINYEQSGSLSAIGLSYSIDLSHKLAIGLTFNIWDHHLCDNSWEIRTKQDMSGFFDDITYSAKYYDIEQFDFKGFNMNLGFLWHISHYFTIGGVVKTPFNADINYRSHNFENEYILSDGNPPQVDESDTISEYSIEHMNMPLSYGLGCLYKPTEDNSWYMAADIYRTHWNKFIYTNCVGDEKSPISGKSIENSDIDPTIQIRMGMEYFYTITETANVIRLRGGLFYDPVPAEGSPDDFYGFSLGTGFVKKNPYAQKKSDSDLLSGFYDDLFSVDIAYQYRFGKDEGKTLMKSRGFSQKKHEHKIYMSVIFYGF
jgi:long-subunit fatty acid transport protein